MRRNGFTMVELIFVIIIIGILSVAAIPKFGDIKDRAKVSTEYGTLSGIDSAIQAAMEFQQEDFGNVAIQWHGQPTGTVDSDATDGYTINNTNEKVLSKILKKNEALKVYKYIPIDYTEATNTTAAGVTGSAMEYDIIFIEGSASNHVNGVKESDATGSLNGKPDKNDVWVFNTSPANIIVHYYDGSDKTMTVESGEIKLIDNLDTMVPTTAATTANGEISVALESSPAAFLTLL